MFSSLWRHPSPFMFFLSNNKSKASMDGLLQVLIISDVILALETFVSLFNPSCKTLLHDMFHSHTDVDNNGTFTFIK